MDGGQLNGGTEDGKTVGRLGGETVDGYKGTGSGRRVLATDGADSRGFRRVGLDDVPLAANLSIREIRSNP